MDREVMSGLGGTSVLIHVVFVRFATSTNSDDLC